MSIEIDVLNGDASWAKAEPLLKAVWSPEVLKKRHGATSSGRMPTCAC
jgi:hypothetical protein